MNPQAPVDDADKNAHTNVGTNVDTNFATSTADLRRLISALADGQADPAESARGMAAWADASSDDARRSWHTYHLIGDVLRSEDLASPPARDQAFLERLRLRLAAEPVLVLPQTLPQTVTHPSPQPLPPPVDLGAERARRRPRWAVPAALAAGVMALATVMVVALGPAGGGGSSVPLAAAPATPAVVTARADAPTPALEATGVGSRVVRDAQLDRYLRAHREYGTALPGSLPGGSGRSITTVSLDR